jgi:hypothetical protein
MWNFRNGGEGEDTAEHVTDYRLYNTFSKELINALPVPCLFGF